MIVNPYLVSHITGISWGEMHTVLRTLETTLEHLTDAVGGPQALVEDALMIVRDVLARPGAQPLMVVAADLLRIIERAAATAKVAPAPAALPPRTSDIPG